MRGAGLCTRVQGTHLEVRVALAIGVMGLHAKGVQAVDTDLVGLWLEEGLQVKGQRLGLVHIDDADQALELAHGAKVALQLDAEELATANLLATACSSRHTAPYSM